MRAHYAHTLSLDRATLYPVLCQGPADSVQHAASCGGSGVAGLPRGPNKHSVPAKPKPCRTPLRSNPLFRLASWVGVLASLRLGGPVGGLRGAGR
eukprot:scaffold7500_cov127-Isochrysis_galbana.AAC.20